jgi:tRNA threonylcarbamoyl adenosine modification protein (Sua5/YciO/YrdC/YwlC family)
MAQYFEIHPTHPQPRLIARAADIVRGGGVIAYPTDSCFALGCHIGDKDAMQRLRDIRGFEDTHHLTLMCRDLSEIALFARVDNRQFRLLKKLTPGSYTFILEASRELPRRLLHSKRRTIGLRVPGHPVAHALIEALNEPLLSTTLMLAGQESPLDDAHEIREHLEHKLDLVLDAGACGLEPSTVIDLSGEVPTLVRQGKGPTESLGLA